MRKLFLIVLAAYALSPITTFPVNEQDLSESVAWLEKEAHRIIRASKRSMKDGTSAFPPQVGIGYNAFWLRDYEYTLEGSISSYSDKELNEACRLFIRSLRSDGAGVDCVKFDGTPFYQPGYGRMGDHPVADGSQFTVGVAWHTCQRTGSAQLLNEILGPLLRTMDAAPRNPKTRLVHIIAGAEWDRCPYGFTDTARKQGDVLFCSLLYVQACRQLSELLLSAHRTVEARKWKAEGTFIEESIREVFWEPKAGLFRAATLKCREFDVWGSAFAVYLGVADARQSKRISSTFRTHYAELVQHGQIRHLPGGTYWEQGCERDTYQNGAFWAAPTGWFVYTLDLTDPDLADRTVIDMVAHFRRFGACEWIHGETRTLPNYLVSAALPLAGIRAMLDRRQKNASSDKPPSRTAE